MYEQDREVRVVVAEASCCCSDLLVPTMYRSIECSLLLGTTKELQRFYCTDCFGSDAADNART